MESILEKVGMREFREHLPQYLLASFPVAITRHGETIGFYIPAHSHSREADLAALKSAAAKFDHLLRSHGVTEEGLLAEFRTLKKERRKK